MKQFLTGLVLTLTVGALLLWFSLILFVMILSPLRFGFHIE